MDTLPKLSEEECLRILRIVHDMRQAQKKFFGGSPSEKREVIALSKKLERQVDDEIENVFRPVKQESLF